MKNRWLVLFALASIPAWAADSEVSKIKKLLVCGVYGPGQTEIGRSADDRTKHVILKTVKFTDQAYNEIIKSFSAAGVKLVDSKTANTAALDLQKRGMDQAKSQVAAGLKTAQGNMGGANAAIADKLKNLPPEQRAMIEAQLKQGMAAGVNPNAGNAMVAGMESMKAQMVQHQEADRALASDVEIDSTRNSLNEVSSSQTREVGGLCPVTDAAKERKDWKEFESILSSTGADGWLRVDLEYRMEKTDVVGMRFRYFDRNANVVVNKTFNGKADSGFSNAEQASRVIASAVPKAVSNAVTDLYK